jgi:4-amino-4-deoxy-L-arabinose transferase-like glycosyltransferase
MTNDEPDYMEYSKRWLKGHPDRVLDVDDSKTPLTVVAWVPRFIKQALHPGYTQNDWGRSDQLAGRYMMLVFFWGVLLYMYVWARKLYGHRDWWLPVLLLCIDPLVMAFTPIITSDMMSVLVIVASFYHYYRWCVTGRQLQFLGCALFAGLACIAKSSLVFIPFIMLLVYVVRWLCGAVQWRRKHIVQALYFALLVWFVLNLGYYFTGTWQTWGSYTFKSAAFQKLMGAMPFLYSLPTLLPRPFIQGFDLLQFHKDVGPFGSGYPYKGVFILGQKFTHGVWYYYAVTAFFKMPMGILGILLGTGFIFIKRFKVRAFGSKYVFVVVPLVVYALLLSLVNPFQQGLRHAMILFPFLYLGAGYLWPYCRWFFSKGRILITGMLAYSMVSVAVAFPDIMHYSNETILPKQNLFHYLAEFNYLQTNIPKDVAPFLQQHPGYTIAPKTPATGKFIIPGAYVYNSTYQMYSYYHWLQAYKPLECYRNVFLVYDIPANR